MNDWTVSYILGLSRLIKSFFFKIVFIFRQRGREGEREGKKHQCVVASGTPPTGDLAPTQACALTESNWQLFGLQTALNPLSHTSQGFSP